MNKQVNVACALQCFSVLEFKMPVLTPFCVTTRASLQSLKCLVYFYIFTMACPIFANWCSPTTFSWSQLVSKPTPLIHPAKYFISCYFQFSIPLKTTIHYNFHGMSVQMGIQVWRLLLSGMAGSVDMGTFQSECHTLPLALNIIVANNH